LSEADPDRQRQKQTIARAIIDQEKPAHTFYALRVAVPTMRLVSLKLKQDENDKPKLLCLGSIPPGVDGALTVLGTST